MAGQESPEIILSTPVGELRLRRMPKSKRFMEVRRSGGFSWSLDRDNLLTAHIEESLGQDLAGSVAKNLFQRASVVWEVASDVPISHEPGNFEELEDTPQLRDAAYEIADTLRAEIDKRDVREEAKDKFNGDIITRQAYAVQLGRRLKSDPDKPERFFGALAPLGVTNLRVVLPHLGFVRAQGTSPWRSWHVYDSPVEPRRFQVDDVRTDVWVRPRYRAREVQAERVTVSMDIPAACEASDDLPEIWLAADSLEYVASVRTVFAPGLSLKGDSRRARKIENPILAEANALAEFLEDCCGPTESLELKSGPNAVIPWSASRVLANLAEDESLLHAMLWVGKHSNDWPFDLWDVVEARNPSALRNSSEIVWYDLDTSRLASEVSERVISERGSEGLSSSAEDVVASCQAAAGYLRSELLPQLEAGVETGLRRDELERVAAHVRTTADVLGDVQISSLLIQQEEDEED